MHNSSKHIVQCIESVLNQSYTNTEILVIEKNFLQLRGIFTCEAGQVGMATAEQKQAQ